MSERYKLIIAGTRSFNDYEMLRNTVFTALLEQARWTYGFSAEIVSGGAPGADTLGGEGTQPNLTYRLKYFRLTGINTVKVQAHAATGKWQNTPMQQ